MNKRSKITALLMGFACLGSILVTTSCKDDFKYYDPMSSGNVTLQVYGPKPALRGAEIRFVGTHMDRVTGVEFPVAGEVTDFTLKTPTEIRLIVPVNAGYGRLILKTPQGDITTDSDMSYTEPIKVTYVTEAATKAGSNIEIKGDFLYLITRVIFQGGAFVDLTDDNKTFSAGDPTGVQTLTVPVPETAISGELILSNIVFDDAGNELGIPVEVGSGEWHANIVEPGVTSLSHETIKAGATLTITGTNLDLVKTIRFGGDKEVETFNLSGTTSIGVTVPADAQDGPVVLIAKSAAENASATPLTMLMPTIASISPNPVRNQATLTVNGTDLDLVTGITFEGSGVIAIDSAWVTSKSATKIDVIVPITAKEGAVAFTTAAAKDALSGELKLVKPVVTGYASAQVAAGGNVTFQGTNFDLVTAVNFVGDKDNAGDDLTVEVTPDSATSLTVAIPALAQAGDVTLTMVNGDNIECPPLTIDAPAFAFIPVLPSDEIKAGEIFAVEIINADKLTEVQVNGTKTQHILQESLLHIFVPSSAAGATEFKLVSSNGEVAYTIPITGLARAEAVLWEGNIDMNAEAWSAKPIPVSAMTGIQPGDLMRVYFRDGNYSDPDNLPMIQFFYGDWGGTDFGDQTPAEGLEYIELELTADRIDKMLHPAWGTDALLLQGRSCVVYKISRMYY